MSDSFEYKDYGLKNLIKALGKEEISGRIGILGDSQGRDGEKTNAEIGLKHEYGDNETPQRSFLRLPLIENLQLYLNSAGAFEKDTIKAVLKTGSASTWLKKVMATAERVVADGFDTGGFGKWKPSNMKYKKNHQTLVETQQLRNSIISEVEDA